MEPSLEPVQIWLAGLHLETYYPNLARFDMDTIRLFKDQDLRSLQLPPHARRAILGDLQTKRRRSSLAKRRAKATSPKASRAAPGFLRPTSPHHHQRTSTALDMYTMNQIQICVSNISQMACLTSDGLPSEDSLPVASVNWDRIYGVTMSFLQNVSVSAGIKYLKACVSESRGASCVTHYLLGLLWYRKKIYQDAVISFLTCSRTNEEFAGGYHGAALCYHKMGRNREAEQQFRTSMKLAPSFAFARHHFGNFLEDCRQIPAALEEYAEACRLLPSNVAFHINLANLLDDNNEIDDAEFHYKAALKLAPSQWMNHSNYALLLERKGVIAEAEHHHGQAAHYGAEYCNPHLQFARFLANQRNYKRSVEELSKILMLKPWLVLDDQLIATYTLMATNCNRLGRTVESMRFGQIKCVLQAQAFAKGGDLRRALNSYREAQAIDPSDVNLNHMIREFCADHPDELGDFLPGSTTTSRQNSVISSLPMIPDPTPRLPITIEERLSTVSDSLSIPPVPLMSSNNSQENHLSHPMGETPPTLFRKQVSWNVKRVEEGNEDDSKPNLFDVASKRSMTGTSMMVNHPSFSYLSNNSNTSTTQIRNVRHSFGQRPSDEHAFSVIPQYLSEDTIASRSGPALMLGTFGEASFPSRSADRASIASLSRWSSVMQMEFDEDMSPPLEEDGKVGEIDGRDENPDPPQRGAGLFEIFNPLASVVEDVTAAAEIGEDLVSPSVDKGKATQAKTSHIQAIGKGIHISKHPHNEHCIVM